MSQPPDVICPCCGKLTHVNKTGQLRVHGYRHCDPSGKVCRGSIAKVISEGRTWIIKWGKLRFDLYGTELT